MRNLIQARIWLLSASVSLVLAACGGGTEAPVAATQKQAPVEMALRVDKVEGFRLPARAEPEKSGPLASERPRPTPGRVRLDPGESTLPLKLAPVPGNRRAVHGLPVQIGFARAVAETAQPAAMAGKLALQPTAGSASAAGAVSFTSPGASALRLGVRVTRLPAAARVRGYSQGGAVAFDVAGQEILETLRRNRDAGDESEAARTWWTPPVENEEVTLEVSLPAGVAATEVEIAVPLLSHIVVTKSQLGNLKAIGDSDSCEVDVTCMPEADASSRATAKMSFVSGGIPYVCSGTLLNDTNASGTPYFLSANHCVSRQAEASSVVTYWLYRASSCNSGVLSPAVRQMDGGAVLLYATSATDTSFMRLLGALPSGVAFAGWMTTPPATATPVMAVHHPAGDLQKVSLGQVVSYQSCSNAGCTNAPSVGRFLETRWRRGTTEQGSSGSGIFVAGSNSHYLVGQLWAGAASCQRPDLTDAYGRFDLAYAEALDRWLSPASPVVPRSPVYRFYNASTGAHFFTRNVAERDAVIAGNPAFRYEGVAYYAYESPIAGASPVFRFYNQRTGRHFYTISEGERDWVATNADFRYEGVSWYAQGGPGGSASALYRFYNDAVATHFYTISAGEKDQVVQSIPAYRLEGVGYYAWTTP